MVFLLTHISLLNALSLRRFPNTVWCGLLNSVGRDSSVGIATCYVLDGPESNPGGDEIFRTHPDRHWGPHSLLYNWYRLSFPGVKQPERGVGHSPLSCAEVKERVELYLYPIWAIMACSGVNFTLFLNSPTRLPVHIRIIHIYLMIIDEFSRDLVLYYCGSTRATRPITGVIIHYIKWVFIELLVQPDKCYYKTCARTQVQHKNNTNTKKRSSTQTQ
jgi:hypothetical protein